MPASPPINVFVIYARENHEKIEVHKPFENPLDVIEKSATDNKSQEVSKPVVDLKETFSITNPEDQTQNKDVAKKIIYSILIIAFLITVGYFAFNKKNKGISNDTSQKDTSRLITYDNYQPQTNETPPVTSNTGGDSKKPPNLNASSIADQTNTIKVPPNSFNSFSSALAAVLRDASNNFQNLKGDYSGMEGKIKKYKTKLTLYDKQFLPSYILQDVSECTFVFQNRNESSYDKMKSAIVSLLTKNNINYDHESSASVGADYYRWNNEKFEINVVGGRYSGGIIQINFFHRN